MSSEEEQIMQQNIDEIRTIFVEEVAKNRDLPVNEVEELADGRFFLGKNALELGLIDELGGKDEAVAWIEQKEDIKAELAEYKRPKTLGELLFEAFNEHGFYMGLGLGESMSVKEGVGITT